MKKMVRTIVVLSLLTLPAGFLYAGTSPSKAQPATNAKAKPDVDHGSARLMSQGNASSAPLLKELGRGPLRFEANAGQFASEAKFVSRGMSHTLFLAPNEAVLELPGRPIAAQGLERFSRLAPQFQHSEGAVARLRLVGANASPEMAGMDLLPGKSNYLVGKDPKQWRTGIAQYARVRYKDVYPGIDWVYYGNEGQLEYDLVVAPGADPDRITLAMEFTRGTNTEALRLDENGDLLLATDEDTIRFHRPRVYQEIDGQKQFIAASYELRPQGQVGFKLGSYDHSQTLVIDPFLSFSTYVGGSATDQATAIAVDGSGNIYVTGVTNSTDFPNTVPARPLDPSGTTCGTVNCPDAFVMKMDSTGTLKYSTYFGGSKIDKGLAIAVDSSGDAIVTGYTDSDDFPLMNAAQPSFISSCTTTLPCDDAFVVELNADGSAPLYSSYLGTSREEQGTGVAIDPTGASAVFVAGSTSPPTPTAFPTTVGAYQTTSGGGTCNGGVCPDGFLARFDFSKVGTASLVYCTLLGGNGADLIDAVAADTSGNAYVVGTTAAANFPIKNAFQGSFGGGDSDAFLAELNPGGAGTADLLHSTYIGGNGNDEATGITTISGAPNVVYVAGVTNSTNAGYYATPGAPQTLLNNTSTLIACGTETCADGFLMKLDLTKAGAAQRTYATYIGGSGVERANAVAADTSGNAFIAGYTNSTNLPTAQPVQAASAGGYDAFITKLSPAGAGSADRLYATYLGGSDTDAAYGIAVDTTTGQPYSGNVYVAGFTLSTDFLVTPGAAQTTNAGDYDVFVARLGPGAAGMVLASPSPLAFGTEPVTNTSSPLTITLRNFGSGNIAGVTATPTGTDASDFAANVTGCATLLGGSTCTLSVTFKPGAVGARSASLGIAFTGGTNSPQNVPLSGTGQDFDFVSQTPSQTVTPPATAQYTLTVTPLGGFGFDNAISFSCTSLPTGAACSAPSKIPGTSAVNSTLSITTTKYSLAPPMSHRGPLPPATPVWFGNPWLAALLLTLLLAVVAGTRQRRAGLVLAAGLLVLLTWTACGGGGGGGGTTPPPTGTPPGPYKITVNAKAGNLTHSTSVTLVVQ